MRDIIPPIKRSEFDDVYIVTDLMDTDLHQIIRSTQALSEEHCQYFLYQMLRALKYIHSANVLHRDLKPSNLLINANCDLRLCDFGLARTTSETDFMTEYVVTRWYRAPELLLNAAEYTSAIDIWSVGCIYMELLDRKPLLPGKDYVHQLRSIIDLVGLPNDSELGFVKSENARKYLMQLPRNDVKPLPEKFPEISPEALDLVSKMLTFDPSKRMSAEDALAHPYLAKLHDEADEPTCPTPYVPEFNELSLSEKEIKDLIYEEAMHYYPHLRS
ncbi:hypothetical protein KP509_04G090800 [Ceratopteris richardii]|nr:hypothetical protein KP509_04G090800 [Ceratopteris richardii]